MQTTAATPPVTLAMIGCAAPKAWLSRQWAGLALTLTTAAALVLLTVGKLVGDCAAMAHHRRQRQMPLCAGR
ncbi:MAG TPA: hypothetical protein VFA12_17350 [Stellaceae bacterium]|nr:hypothetical protein [Stellaceae bacterium]